MACPSNPAPAWWHSPHAAQVHARPAAVMGLPALACPVSSGPAPAQVRVLKSEEDSSSYVLCRRWIHNNPYPEASRSIPPDAGPPHPSLQGVQFNSAPPQAQHTGPRLPPLPPAEPASFDGPDPEEAPLPDQSSYQGEVPMEVSPALLPSNRFQQERSSPGPQAGVLSPCLLCSALGKGARAHWSLPLAAFMHQAEMQGCNRRLTLGDDHACLFAAWGMTS